MNDAERAQERAKNDAAQAAYKAMQDAITQLINTHGHENEMTPAVGNNTSDGHGYGCRVIHDGRRFNITIDLIDW